MNAHLVGFSGSLRKESYNTRLLKAVLQLLPDGLTMEIISIADIPLFNEDHEPPAVPDYPAPVKTFREAIRKADGMLIVSPEYNYSIPGVLKNAIDWASRGTDAPVIGKPVSLMGATPGLWGTARMHMAFQPVFHTLNMKAVHKPEVYIAKAKEKFDNEGNLVDETAKKMIVSNLEELKKIIAAWSK
jgi:chromate reductase